MRKRNTNEATHLCFRIAGRSQPDGALRPLGAEPLRNRAHRVRPATLDASLDLILREAELPRCAVCKRTKIKKEKENDENGVSMQKNKISNTNK